MSGHRFDTFSDLMNNQTKQTVDQKPETPSTSLHGKTLAIIGTAGRKDDQEKMSLAVQQTMTAYAERAMKVIHATGLISGGAAWADHVAVSLVMKGAVPAENLKLVLPAKLTANGFENTRDGGISNYYHKLFREKSGIDGIAELNEVARRGAIIEVDDRGFFARNTIVARESQAVLAFTFGHGEPWKVAVFSDNKAMEAGLKDGGTAHTWDQSRAKQKIHVTLAPITTEKSQQTVRTNASANER